MSEEHLITWVGNPRDYRTTAGHELVAYELKVENDDRVIEWSRKVESSAPKVGELTPYADIEDGPHGPKLKVDWDAVKMSKGQRPPQPRTADFKSASGVPYDGRESQDARQASIVRQHSQDMALRYADLTGLFGSGGLREDKLDADPRSKVPTQFWSLVDQFQADANGATMPTKTEDDIPF